MCHFRRDPRARRNRGKSARAKSSTSALYSGQFQLWETQESPKNPYNQSLPFHLVRASGFSVERRFQPPCAIPLFSVTHGPIRPSGVKGGRRQSSRHRRLDGMAIWRCGNDWHCLNNYASVSYRISRRPPRYNISLSPKVPTFSKKGRPGRIVRLPLARS